MTVVKNFLIPVINRPKRCSLPDLLLTSKEKLVRDVKASGNLGCSNHELVEFKILREASKMNSRITATLDLRRVDFGFFKVCLARSQVKRPWKLKGPRKAE